MHRWPSRRALYRRDGGSVRDRPGKGPISHAACSRRHPHAHRLLPLTHAASSTTRTANCVRAWNQRVDSTPASAITRRKQPRGYSSYAARSYANGRSRAPVPLASGYAPPLLRCAPRTGTGDRPHTDVVSRPTGAHTLWRLHGHIPRLAGRLPHLHGAVGGTDAGRADPGATETPS